MMDEKKFLHTLKVLTLSLCLFSQQTLFFSGEAHAKDTARKLREFKLT